MESIRSVNLATAIEHGVYGGYTIMVGLASGREIYGAVTEYYSEYFVMEERSQNEVVLKPRVVVVNRNVEFIEVIE